MWDFRPGFTSAKHNIIAIYTHTRAHALLYYVVCRRNCRKARRDATNSLDIGRSTTVLLVCGAVLVRGARVQSRTKSHSIRISIDVHVIFFCLSWALKSCTTRTVIVVRSSIFWHVYITTYPRNKGGRSLLVVGRSICWNVFFPPFSQRTHAAEDEWIEWCYLRVRNASDSTFNFENTRRREKRTWTAWTSRTVSTVLKINQCKYSCIMKRSDEYSEN